MVAPFPHRSTAVAVVAEDEPLLRLDLADTLSEFGFDVLEAATAAEALRGLASRSDISLLVTDVQMPGEMNGFELAHEVATRWPATRIIICSAFVTPQPGQMPASARFLDKPYSPGLLMGLMRDMQIPVPRR